MKKKFASISDELIDLHEHIRIEWPYLLRIAVALHDKETGMLHTFIRSTVNVKMLDHYSCELCAAKSLLDMSESHEPRLLEDLSVLKNSQTKHSTTLAQSDFNSSYTVPMYLNDSLLGFVFFDSTKLDYFSPQLQQKLVEYSRLLESLIISEVLPIKSLIGMVNTTREITRARDEETGKHLTRMAHYVEIIALEVADNYNLSDEEIEYMWFYAPLHDIGKIAIPDTVLMKPGKLNDEEYRTIMTHVDEGEKMLNIIISNFDFQQIHHLDILKNIITQHHERLDGSGYPKGLKADQISIAGKITAIADVFDAMTSKRVYSDAQSIDETLQYLQENSGTLFEKECVEAMIKNKAQLVKIHQKFKDDLLY